MSTLSSKQKREKANRRKAVWSGNTARKKTRKNKV
jgi:hypothetical protein